MNIKLAGIINSSIVNGEGIRTVLFGTGCIHNCDGCHNKQLTIYESGNDLDLDLVIDIVEKNSKVTSKRITFSGGDPFYQAKEFYELALKLKNKGFNIWCYTGYTIEQILKSNNSDFINLLNTVDVLVDGRFDKNLLDSSIKYRGSSNQRIINVKEFLLNLKED